MFPGCYAELQLSSCVECFADQQLSLRAVNTETVGDAVIK